MHLLASVYIQQRHPCPHMQKNHSNVSNYWPGERVGNSKNTATRATIAWGGGEYILKNNNNTYSPPPLGNRGRQCSSNGGSRFLDSHEGRLSIHHRHWYTNGHSWVQDSYAGRISSHHCHYQNGKGMRYSRSHNHNHNGRGSNDYYHPLMQTFGIASISDQSMLDHLAIYDPSTISSNTCSSYDLNIPQRGNKKDSTFQKEIFNYTAPLQKFLWRQSPNKSILGRKVDIML